MKRQQNAHPKTWRKIADRIARVSGYRDHADALAHRDPKTGKIPAKNPDLKKARRKSK